MGILTPSDCSSPVASNTSTTSIKISITKTHTLTILISIFNIT
jgi:hypothetical protein